MKKIILLSLCSILGAHFGWADDGTRAAQSALKAKGFYFGELDGELSAETAAAIKRFQIRNALEITGTLTPQTSEALNQGDEKPEAPHAASPAPAELPAAPSVPALPASRVPPQSAAPERVPVWGLRETPRPAEAAGGAQSAGRAPEEGGFPQLFAKTPFASAPLEVQRSTVRKAQALLRRDDIFHEAIDGQPGAAFEEALLIYQRRVKLALSGRLDLETLSQMHLLPGGGPALQPFNEGSAESRVPKKAYRGVWVR